MQAVANKTPDIVLVPIKQVKNVIKNYDEEIAIALEDLATEEVPEFEEIPYIDLWVDNSSDIIGGALLSAGLVMMYYSIKNILTKKH